MECCRYVLSLADVLVLGPTGHERTATASYRLHPLIILNPEKPIPLQHAKKFASCFSPGVVTVSEEGEVSIDHKYMRNDSVSREVLRHKEFEGCVELKRIRDWFICAFIFRIQIPYMGLKSFSTQHSQRRVRRAVCSGTTVPRVHRSHATKNRHNQGGR